jgi:hypothetical protein
VADPAELERDLQTLASELRRLEGEYHAFFAGRSPRPPLDARQRVDALLKRWERAHIENLALRFRLQSLQARYATFADLWDRSLRAREEGRPGPWSRPAAEADASPRSTASATERGAESFRDPRRELDKLERLYHVVADARRETGEAPVPFHRFAELVKDQVTRLRPDEGREVVFRVSVREGRVNLTARVVRAAHGVEGDGTGEGSGAGGSAPTR